MHDKLSRQFSAFSNASPPPLLLRLTPSSFRRQVPQGSPLHRRHGRSCQRGAGARGRGRVSAVRRPAVPAQVRQHLGLLPLPVPPRLRPPARQTLVRTRYRNSPSEAELHMKSAGFQRRRVTVRQVQKAVKELDSVEHSTGFGEPCARPDSGFCCVCKVLLFSIFTGIIEYAELQSTCFSTFS